MCGAVYVSELWLANMVCCLVQTLVHSHTTHRDIPPYSVASVVQTERLKINKDGEMWGTVLILSIRNRVTSKNLCIQNWDPHDSKFMYSYMIVTYEWVYRSVAHFYTDPDMAFHVGFPTVSYRSKSSINVTKFKLLIKKKHLFAYLPA